MQVFVNLLRNAIYAIESQGRIVVRARQEGRSWVTIAVEDDGLGIPEDVLPNIFEAFVTSRLDSRGTGLGLTVAEGIVHQHGGTLVASNREEGGARLEVRLPAAASEAGVA
jgi:two-component system NtrC family sensor kinase